jgi:Zn finger protein HypA/HybF involved in hydrogenase expression
MTWTLKIRSLLGTGLSYNEISRAVGCSKSTVHWHAKRLGHAIKELKRYDWVAVQRSLDAGWSRRECETAYGFSKKTWDNAVSSKKIAPQRKDPFAFLQQRKRINGNSLKRALNRVGIPYRCSECKIRSWRGVRLSLQVDHKDGDYKNNSLENLRLLCPNCHSQTPTFAGRNCKRNRTIRKMVGLPGNDPGLKVSETSVLPLHQSPTDENGGEQWS